MAAVSTLLCEVDHIASANNACTRRSCRWELCSTDFWWRWIRINEQLEWHMRNLLITPANQSALQLPCLRLLHTSKSVDGGQKKNSFRCHRSVSKRQSCKFIALSAVIVENNNAKTCRDQLKGAKTSQMDRGEIEIDSSNQRNLSDPIDTVRWDEKTVRLMTSSWALSGHRYGWFWS